MARFDVFVSPSSAGYLLDVQTDLLDGLNTRVVVPLVPAIPTMKLVPRLNPLFDLSGRQYAMFTHLIATVPSARLGEPQANFAGHHDQITAALDMLFQGF